MADRDALEAKREYNIKLREERGPDAVADLSLGNPCNDPPAEFYEALRAEALRWALERSSRSGRTARQFVDDFAGREAPADGT